MKSRLVIPFLGLVLLFSAWESCMAQKGDYLLYKDSNKPINARIKDLMSRMTLSEKIGQMTQLDRRNLTIDIMKNYGIGSVLSGGGSVPKSQAIARDWVDMPKSQMHLPLSTTILDAAITASVDANTEVVYSESPTTEFLKSNNFSFSIVVVGEPPYGETAGDNMNLTITEAGIDTMSNVCGSTKCAVVLISGRPLVVLPYLSNIDALVTAWLPGTEGQGVADVLFGDYEFSGKLPTTWFKNVNQLPKNDPLYPFGFGHPVFR